MVTGNKQSLYDREHLSEILADRAGKKYDWFNANLFRLILKADNQNRELLRQIWPEQVKDVEQYIRYKK